MASTEKKVAVAVGGTFLIDAALSLTPHMPGGVGFITSAALASAMALSVDNLEVLIGKEFPSLPRRTSSDTSSSDTEQPSLLYRMVHGKSVREGASELPTPQPQEDAVTYQPRRSQDLSKLRQNVVLPSHKARIDTEPTIPAVTIPAKKDRIPPGGFKPMTPIAPQQQVELSLDPRFPLPTDMAAILEKGFRPAKDSILLMKSSDGYVTEKISKLGHIGLAGETGGGKTNINRLLLAQLLYCGAKVFLINPNHAPT